MNAEGEVRFSITDGSGRGVISGAIDKNDLSTVVTYSTSHYDTVTAAGLLETSRQTALGFTSSSRTDGLGRTWESENAEGDIAVVTYDNNGNVLTSRDASRISLTMT